MRKTNFLDLFKDKRTDLGSTVRGTHTGVDNLFYKGPESEVTEEGVVGLTGQTPYEGIETRMDHYFRCQMTGE